MKSRFLPVASCALRRGRRIRRGMRNEKAVRGGIERAGSGAVAPADAQRYRCAAPGTRTKKAVGHRQRETVSRAPRDCGYFGVGRGRATRRQAEKPRRQKPYSSWRRSNCPTRCCAKSTAAAAGADVAIDQGVRHPAAAGPAVVLVEHKGCLGCACGAWARPGKRPTAWCRRLGLQRSLQRRARRCMLRCCWQGWRWRARCL